MKKLAIRYAKALFQSADKEKRQEYLKDFEDLLELCRKTPKLSAFLNSPEINLQNKEKVLNEAFKERPNFSDFLSLLLRKGRFKYLTAIASEYRTIFTTSYGITDAHLTTAIPVDAAMQENLKEKLEKTYNKQFELICNTSPKIIGGGILLINAHMIDFRIKNRLERLKNHLLSS